MILIELYVYEFLIELYVYVSLLPEAGIIQGA